MSEADKILGPPAPGQWRESPIINNPYEMPELHLKLSKEPSIDNLYLVAEGRRAPGIVPKVKDGKPTDGKAEKDNPGEPYGMIGRIRGYVNDWREGGFQEVDVNTARLLHHWTEVKDGRGLFFCQREAIETLIWLHTFKGKDHNCDEVHRQIDDWNKKFNDELPRLSTKMATGTGKTVVMAMLMLWMALRSKDPVNNFLVITPGITVTERLGDLKGDGGRDVFSDHELLPRNMHKPPMNIEIHHRHKLEPRSGTGVEIDGKPLDKVSAGIMNTHTNDLAERLQGEGLNVKVGSVDESFQSVIDRLCGRHPDGSPITIINDEAHHCYATSGSEENNRKWYNAVRDVRDKTNLEIASIHDFSATPIWIDKRRTEAHDNIFPWTVSDFPLIEAVESGLTKIPRIPTDVDSEGQKQARDVFGSVSLTEFTDKISIEVQGYLGMLVRHHLDDTRIAYEGTGNNPILCVVANTIENAQAFYRTIAGHWDDDPSKREMGEWEELSNIEKIEGQYVIKKNPPTLLVHSEVDKGKGADVGETGVVDSSDLLAFFGDNENNKAKYKNLANKIRQLFNTAGQRGAKGEHIRCIVSVSMLTEGWDCRTVTEIFGFRAFKSDLLVEQVTGRALRRTSYDLDENGLLSIQHANLIGINFQWVPNSSIVGPEPVPVEPYDSRVMEGREHMKIEMPCVERYEVVPEHTKRVLNPVGIEPHNLEVQGPADAIVVTFIGGQVAELCSEKHRMSTDRAIWTIAAKATNLLIEGETKPNEVRERLPVMRDMLVAARKWWVHPKSFAKRDRIERVVGNGQVAEKCALALLSSCGPPQKKESWVRAILQRDKEMVTSAEPPSITRRLKHRYPSKQVCDNGGTTNCSQRDVAPCHSDPEVSVAKCLDHCGKVDAWIRNEGIGFYIPYRGTNGHQRYYEPDFVARTKKGNLLVIEFKGEWKGKIEVHEDSKLRYTKNLWIPAVNAEMKHRGGNERWGILWLEKDSLDNIEIEVLRSMNELDRETGTDRETTRSRYDD